MTQTTPNGHKDELPPRIGMITADGKNILFVDNHFLDPADYDLNMAIGHMAALELWLESDP